MIRIGDFSKLSHVTVKALRLYDEMGLLKPVLVDTFTSYRYYEFSQLTRLYRILALKDLGLSLEEIGSVLENEVSVEHLRGMLALRQAEIRQRMREDEVRLERVANWLEHLKEERPMSVHAVVLKTVESFKVASMRGIVPQPPDQNILWDEVIAFMERHKARMAGAPFAIYHDPDFREKDWDIEVCQPVVEAVPSSDKVKVYDLPRVEKMACVVHHGPFATLPTAYDSLAAWIDQNGYRIVGPAREINLRLPDTMGDQNDPNTVNEVQFPVEKA
ncbi:MAG: MerR family transcriptional regulator [Anaerolineales bacterium]|nr:MerR family transcriptional regulator [Anaerolineales bacterium]